ncbi:hypothetical protein [Mesorhizobium sp. M0041]|uniref:hypothetical protein n=1 Tax=Mesorhizobium sp. M0041 TaxID=2956856 RepID=UPI00333863B3
MTKTTRKEMLVAADTILKANPVEKSTAIRIRYRGGRPALTWMKKHNATGAAALWLVARERLPQAANDNLPIEAGLNVDRSRKDGGRAARIRFRARWMRISLYLPFSHAWATQSQSPRHARGGLAGKTPSSHALRSSRSGKTSNSAHTAASASILLRSLRVQASLARWADSAISRWEKDVVMCDTPTAQICAIRLQRSMPLSK